MELHPNIHCKYSIGNNRDGMISPWLAKSFPLWDDHKWHTFQQSVGTQSTCNLPHSKHGHEHCKMLSHAELAHMNNIWSSSCGTDFPLLGKLAQHQLLSLHMYGISLKKKEEQISSSMQVRSQFKSISQIKVPKYSPSSSCFSISSSSCLVSSSILRSASVGPW